MTTVETKHWIKELKADRENMRTLLRQIGMLALVFADGIEDEVLEALSQGCTLSYTIQGTKPN